MSIRLSVCILTLMTLLGWMVGSSSAVQDWDDDKKEEVENPAPGGSSGGSDQLDALTFVRGVEVPVAAARPLADGESPKTVMVDTYLDWDFGALLFVGEDGALGTMPAPKNWEFRHVQMPNNGGMVALCFQPGTGLSYLLDGSGTWAPIEEAGTELVVGDYDVTLAIDVDRVFALRFDRFSGRSWSLEEEGWSPIAGNLLAWPATEDSDK